MKNVTLTRGEATLFLATLLVPLLAIGALSLLAFPQLQWMMPTSLFFPAGLLAGIAIRGRAGAALRGPARPVRAARL